jgi:hypothetical protein
MGAPLPSSNTSTEARTDFDEPENVNTHRGVSLNVGKTPNGNPIPGARVNMVVVRRLAPLELTGVSATAKGFDVRLTIAHTKSCPVVTVTSGVDSVVVAVADTGPIRAVNISAVMSFISLFIIGVVPYPRSRELTPTVIAAFMAISRRPHSYPPGKGEK